MIVDTTAVQLDGYGTARIVVQNLGPDTLFLGNDDTVTDATGVAVSAGGDYTSPGLRGADLWIVSDGECDVRILSLGG